MDKSGKYHANPSMARAADSMSAAPAVTDPNADPNAQGQSITLTKNPDGTVTCDCGDGKPMPYGSVDEALDAAKSMLGGGEMGSDDGTGPMGGGGELEDMA